MGCIHDDGFSAIARDHAANPRNCGPLKTFDGHGRVTGPCGDTMEFWLVVQNDTVQRVTFITDGCGSSHACGSMATTLAEGKRIQDASALSQQDILNALGGFPSDSEHCALLAANTLQAACEDYLHRGRGTATHSSDAHAACNTCGNTDRSAHAPNAGETDEERQSSEKLHSRLSHIRHRIIVLSGKGGVGKSTVAVNLAAALAMSGKRVGLLDIDIHGPSIPTMLGLQQEMVLASEDGLLPIEMDGMKIMSLGFILHDEDVAVIWRGPLKMSAIKQFLRDVDWGELDYLIIDSPPGTGDEPMSVCQLIGTLDGAVIVTTPQKVAEVDVRKSITFCRQLNVPVLGVVENMSGFVCPKCGEVTQILPPGAGNRIAESMHVPFLGSIPIDPMIAQACDSGQAFIQHFSTTRTAEIMRQIVAPITALDEASHTANPQRNDKHIQRTSQ